MIRRNFRSINFIINLMKAKYFSFSFLPFLIKVLDKEQEILFAVFLNSVSLKDIRSS